jgi:hypothetical protein
MVQREKLTVLIIGSGLSAASDFHLPTMRGFFGPDLESHHQLWEFLNWLYPHQSPEDYNLEEVMSFLNLSNNRLPLWGSSLRAVATANSSTLYDELLEYVKTRLAIEPRSVCGTHRRLFQTLAEQDTIISFNYDLVADNALLDIEPREHNRPLQDSRMGKLSGLLGRLDIWSDPPPSLMPREQNWGFYLKLHGSLDWLHCETPGCTNNVNLFALGVAELSEGQHEGMPCRYCGAALKTFIVPPIATKRMEDRSRMAFLWNLALRELISAHRIDVIGLSFAPSDFELRWLVRQAVALRPNQHYELHVVNQSKEHRTRINTSFPGPGKTLFEYPTINDYLAKHPINDLYQERKKGS